MDKKIKKKSGGVAVPDGGNRAAVASSGKKKAGLSKKVKTVIACATAAVLVCGVTVGCLMVFGTQKVGLKVDSLWFEYGEVVAVDCDGVVDTEDEEVLGGCSVDLGSLVYADENDYPEVGSYMVEVEFDGKKEELKIEVEDTVAPEFTEFSEEVKFTVGVEGPDYDGYFKADDLSEVVISVDESAIDYKVEGEYATVVIAEDGHGNKVEKEFKVIIEPEASANVPSGGSQPGQVGFRYVNGILVVNKKYALPSDYAPGEDATAGAAIRNLIHDMRSAGYDISTGYSGYRSYSYQNGLYWGYVNSYGQAQADTFSARAGHSEHQSGLAFDLLHAGGQLMTGASEVDWVADNAHKYGFIVRYQSGKEHITGYMAEPWHLRYVGDKAEAIWKSGLTLEEYLGIDGGGYM